jgi:hypothetical protein
MNKLEDNTKMDLRELSWKYADYITTKRRTLVKVVLTVALQKRWVIYTPAEIQSACKELCYMDTINCTTVKNNCNTKCKNR